MPFPGHGVRRKVGFLHNCDLVSEVSSSDSAYLDSSEGRDMIPRNQLEAWMVALDGRLGICVVSWLMPVDVGGEARGRQGMGYVFSGSMGAGEMYTVGKGCPQSRVGGRGDLTHE